MLLHVEVTAEDIVLGVRFSCTDCPIARALCRATGEPGAVASICGRSLSVVAGSHWWRGDTPEAANVFIGRFDECDPVEPFAFDVKMQEIP